MLHTPYKSHTLKLSHDSLLALDWWLRYVISQPRSGNYYEDLHLIILGKLWEEKVYPKTGVKKSKLRTIKMDEMTTLALSMSFVVHDHFNASSVVQSILYLIQEQLIKLCIDERERFEPQVLLIE